MKRVFIYFVAYFAAIALPIGLLLFLASTGPAPYVLGDEGIGADWLQPRDFADGSTVDIQAYGSDEEAVEAARALFEARPTTFVNRTFDIARFRRTDNERHGLILPVERYVIDVEAPTAELLEERFASLDFIEENPEPNYLWIALTEWASLSLAGVGIYVVLLIFALARGGAWAGRLTPHGAVAPAEPETLRRRLLAINALNQPFHVVEEGAGRLVAEWRLADPAWTTVMATSGLRRAYRFYLDIDEATRTVRVLEKTYKIAWDGGIRSVSGRVAFFQGITFKSLDGGAALGVSSAPGAAPVANEGYAYRFDPSEIRKPLAEIVTGNGWTWQPVMTFFRPVGG